MKGLITPLFLIAFFNSPFITAQQPLKATTHNVWIYTNNGGSVIKGELQDLKDSSVLLTSSSCSWCKKEIAVRDIESMKIRKKKKLFKSAAIGWGIGLVAGAVIGLAQGDDDCSGFKWFCLSAEEKALINAPIFAAAGALIGFAVGGIKIKIPINGNQKTYEESRQGLHTKFY